MLNVSLIIPAYNEEGYIGDCLTYALKNSHGAFHEIIVIDNASTDTTAEIAKNFPGVKVVSELNKGLVHARQRGYLAATGDVLAYIDADTRMPEKWVDKLIKEFSDNPRLACLSGPYIYYDIPAVQQFLIMMWYICARPLYYLTGYMATGGNFAIRRDVVTKMGGFDTTISFYGEDTNIARRAHKFGKVKFTSKFAMYTSARRFKKQGLFRTGFDYAINFFSEAVLHKPITGEYTDIR